jgi:hypothetical protein
MKLTIKKTDKRYTGSDTFGYVVDIRNDNAFPVIHSKFRKSQKIVKFQEVRDWCIQTWGMSCEREHYLQLSADEFNTNTHWCWHTEYYDTKIYLRTDKEANWFKLKWL